MNDALARSCTNDEMNDETNKVEVIGYINDDFTFNHSSYGENFYSSFIVVPRLSDNLDIIPIMCPEINLPTEFQGKYIYIKGQFRSHNIKTDNRTKLALYLFCDEIICLDDNENAYEASNNIFLNGFLCKPPMYRKTPTGKEICDLLIAVNRKNGKSDYIPCICWGRNARKAFAMHVGDNICVLGRIQSRTYKKQFEDYSEIRTAYEISISSLHPAQEAVTAQLQTVAEKY